MDPQLLWQCYDEIHHQEQDRRMKTWRQFVKWRHANNGRLLQPPLSCMCGGVVGSWLVRRPLNRAVLVWALAEDTVLCPWARHLTLTVPLSIQVYKCVILRWTSIEILLVAWCYWNQHKHRPDEPVGSYTDVTLFPSHVSKTTTYVLVWPCNHSTDIPTLWYPFRIRDWYLTKRRR